MPRLYKRTNMSEKFRDKYRIPTSRLPNWDYSDNGYYFITICTKDKEIFFGNILNNKMCLSRIGEIANKCWFEIPNHFPCVELDEFVVMPNHVHGIIIIRNFRCRDGACPVSTKRNTLGNIVGSFKSVVTKYINSHQLTFGWQPRFYEHIIRNEKEFYRVKQYVKNNPINWEVDRNNNKKKEELFI